MIKVVILISGRGSNMKAIIEAILNKQINVEVVCVIADNYHKSEEAIAYATKQAVDNKVIDRASCDNKHDFEGKILELLGAYEPDYICLAGFMRILSPNFVDEWSGRIINIHPSLLPKFKGATAIKDALKAGEEITGCTVHFVTEQVDSGEIIVQKKIEIDDNDDEESLAKKIHPIEHESYIEALSLLSQKR